MKRDIKDTDIQTDRHTDFALKLLGGGGGDGGGDGSGER